MLNPEFQRNLWLEFTLHRLIALPVVITALFILANLINSANGINYLASLLAYFFLFLWGGKRASEGVIEEVNAKTWDFQRVSSISPWTMAWGKLIGSPSFAWYGALICFLGLAYASFGVSETSIPVYQKTFILIIGGLFCHTLALLFSLESMQAPRNKKLKTFPSFILALSVSFPSTLAVMSVFQTTSQAHIIHWFEVAFVASHFILVSFIIFLAWSILAIYRLMQKELQYPILPWAWPLFNLFCLFYLAGLLSPASTEGVLFHINGTHSLLQSTLFFEELQKYMLFFVGLFFVYASLFSETLPYLRYKKFFSAIYQKSWKGMFEHLPRWVSSVCFLFALSLWMLLWPTQAWDWNIHLESIKPIAGRPVMLVFTLLLFLGRDTLLFHFFQFSQDTKRAKLATLFYLAILYMLLPALLRGFHLNSGVPFLLPMGGKFNGFILLGIATQVIIMALFMRKRWVQTRKNIGIIKPAIKHIK